MVDFYVDFGSYLNDAVDVTGLSLEFRTWVVPQVTRVTVVIRISG